MTNQPMHDREMETWQALLPRLAPLLPTDLFERLRSLPHPVGPAADIRRNPADDLYETIQTLSRLHHTLTNFLPRYLIDLAPTPGEPHGELLEGSYIFADVTGFTHLTEELSRRGDEGLEEMNRLMNRLFAALLDPLLESGGDLLIFAGDAVLACFPAHPDRPVGQDARWATRTALRLVAAIADFAHIHTPYGDFSLTMSAGVERGRALAAIVGTGGRRRRMELLVSGGPVQGAMHAEALGAPGQVIVGPGVRPFLRPEEFILQDHVVVGIRGGELDDYEPVPPPRRPRLATILSRRIPDLIEQLQYALVQVEKLAPFFPPPIFAHIVQGQDFRQHPPVAVQFVNVRGVEELALGMGAAGPELATAVLQRYFVQAQEIVRDRQGIVNQVDPYASGFVLVDPFGAPTHHEGVPRLAASAALELAHALERVNREFDLDPPLTQRIGMTYDRIFTGEIGYRHRREYLIAGPAVNLAARLMSKAEAGQIVLAPTAWEAVQADFRADPLPPIPLKGIAEPVPRFALRGIRGGRGAHLSDYPLIGRTVERTSLQERLAPLLTDPPGGGGALLLTGAAGIGKSRLADALADDARSRGMQVLTGRCRPFTRTTPYAPWAELVGRWFDVPPDWSAEGVLAKRRERLAEKLAQLGLERSLPAFADLLGFPPMDTMAQMERSSTGRAGGPQRNIFAIAQQRAEQATARTHSHSQEQAYAQGTARSPSRGQEKAPGEREPSEEQSPLLWKTLRERASIPQALTRALERQASQQPTLVIIENLQWMDTESRHILEAVRAVTSAAPLFLLVTAQPDADGWKGERMALSPLSEADGLALAALALQATRLAPDLADWLSDRVGGHPLFILSYCQALRDAGAVVSDPIGGEARWSGPPPELPLSLQETLLAQMDRLAPETQAVIKRSAVIGTTFPTWLLDILCREVLTTDQMVAALGQAARRGLIAPPPPAPAHTFLSHSFHEAVYTTLPHALRRAWHERIGDALQEHTDASHLHEWLEQIAYHYSRSGHPGKAAHFTRLAGDKARAHQAYEAALAFYAQTLAITNGDGEGVAIEQQRAYEGIGDIHAARGEHGLAAAQAVLLEQPE